MVTTITTTTLATLGTSAADSLPLIALLTLLVLLILKEIVSGLEGPRAKVLDRVLMIAIVPLLMSLAVTVGLRLLSLH